MSVCPNGDPSFNRVLERMVGQPTPLKRLLIFYGVCIPVRLSLYLAVLYFHNARITPYLVGIFSLVAIINLAPSLWSSATQTQWWSKRFQAVMSILIFSACILVALNKIPSLTIPILLLSSLGIGILQSFITPIC